MNETKIAKPKLSFLSKFRNRNKYHSLLVHIIHKNKNMSHSIIKTDDRKFNLLSNTYIIDDDKLFYDTTYKQNALLYVEGIPTPMDTKADKSGLIKFNLDSQSLTSVIKMEYVEMLTKVAKIKDKMNLILMFVFINGAISLITLVLMLKQSGVIQ